MELRRDRSLSAVHERSQIKQPITPLLEERANPTDAAKLGLGHSFDNSRQASIEISASFISNNAEASSQVNNTKFYNQPHFSTQFQFDDSNLVSSGNFQPQLNEEDLTSYSQMQHNCEWNSLRHSSRTLSPNDLPACLDIGNSDSIFDMDKIQSNDSFHISQLNMISQNQDKIPSNYLQPTFPFPAYQSPNLNPFHLQPSPGSSRHNSLGAGSDNIFHGGSPHDLNLMQSQFQGHRRTPSVYSDVSTPSVQRSPNIGIHDLSDRFHSPKFTPKDSSMIHDFLDIGYFSLNDSQAQNVHSSRSPDYSSENSQQSEPQQNNILGSYDGDSHEGFVHREQIFSQESFPSLNKDLGLPQQMIPPEINVEFAPTRRKTSMVSPKPSLINQDALTLPEKARRPRAFTDTTNANSTTAPRALLPFSNSPRRESNLSQTGFSHPNHSLSPHSDLGATPPSRPRGRSTPSTPNRKYILSPVDSENKAIVPENGSSKRPQKYPAIAQCNLCPKRFTRAYNLRSHLRTHTDERPFACSICKRAFARQHDRKRHESLHSGEKKFICKGKLKPTGEWGCGKPFARADALGRHFRSEAGRVCINPLLEEETRERQQAWNEQQIQNEQQTQNMYNMQQPMQIDSNGFSGNFMLPAALLAQYPALATLSWSGLSQADVSKEDDLSWANTFDASGSEYYDDGDEGGYISSGPTSQQHV